MRSNGWAVTVTEDTLRGFIGVVTRPELAKHAGKHPRDVEIIEMTFGIGREKWTEMAITGYYGVTRARVRQLRDRALRRIGEVL